MSTALATTQHQKASALAVLASRFSVDPIKLLDTLKQTVFKNATEAQLMALVIVANEFKLNPFTKEIYAFPGKNGEIVPLVSVDGWIKLMNTNEAFDGIEFEMVEKDGKPVSCTAVIYIKGRSRPVKVTEYYTECSRNTDPWNKSPRRMLRHKALIQGARVAFGLSGIHDEDDAEVMAEKPIGGTVVDVKAPERPQLGNAADPDPMPKQRASKRPDPKPIDVPVEVIEQPAPEPQTTLQKLQGLREAAGVDELDLIRVLAPVRNEGVEVTKLEFLTADEQENALKHWDAVMQALKTAPEEGTQLAPEDQLRALCVEHEVSEAEVLAYLASKKRTKENPAGFEDVNPGGLTWAIEKFKAIADFVKANRAK